MKNASDLTSEEYEQLRANVHKEAKKRKLNEIQVYTLKFRTILHRLRICRMHDSFLDWPNFICKHSPYFKNKVK